jgi:hypothetical protein
MVHHQLEHPYRKTYGVACIACEIGNGHRARKRNPSARNSPRDRLTTEQQDHACGGRKRDLEKSEQGREGFVSKTEGKSAVLVGTRRPVAKKVIGWKNLQQPLLQHPSFEGLFDCASDSW